MTGDHTPQTTSRGRTAPRRRRLLHAFIAIGCSLLIPTAAQAASLPPLRLVTPYPAGGPTDVVARVIAEPLSETLGQSVIVDNRAGGSGTIGANFVARSAPDGNTLLLNTSIQVILPHLMKLPYDTQKDFTPIGQINSIPFILVINKDLPVKNVSDLVAYARAHPGQLNFASNSAGSASQLAAEQFKMLTGVKITHIPYKGSAPAITDLIGGQVQMMFEQGPSVLPFLKSGQLRALAVTSPTRAAIAPDIPTFKEEGIPLEYSNWQGIWAPANLPPPVATRLTSALRKTLQRADVRQRLQDLGTEPSSVVGSDFAQYADEQYRAIGEIVRAANVKLN